MSKITFLTAIILTCHMVADGAPIVKDEDVKFYLYTKNVTRKVLNSDNYGDDFNRNATVKMFIHGWGEDMETFWYSSTRSTYVRNGFNVITVDWCQHAQVDYHLAFVRVPLVADVIARFIIGFCKTHNISLDNLHIIGHCLGAHVAGFTGKTVYSQCQEKIGRITGLDPSGITFAHAKETGRLAEGDAVNVDTIVTDAGIQGLGLNKSIGHVNFFPNGGTATQPGCRRYPCSHNRAAVYFHESIVSDKLIGKRCGNYANYNTEKCKVNSLNVLGEGVDFTVKGDFYLNTTARSPFGLGNV